MNWMRSVVSNLLLLLLSSDAILLGDVLLVRQRKWAFYALVLYNLLSLFSEKWQSDFELYGYNRIDHDASAFPSLCLRFAFAHKVEAK